MTMTEDTARRFAWDYSERSDIFNLHRKGAQTIAGAELGDFTVDFGQAGDVAGFEIMNASAFLSPMGITKHHLSGLRSASFAVKRAGGNHAIIWMTLILPPHTKKVVPLPAPILLRTARAIPAAA